jgi:hypothetical protein
MLCQDEMSCGGLDLGKEAEVLTKHGIQERSFAAAAEDRDDVETSETCLGYLLCLAAL